MNWAAVIAWGISIVLFVILLITNIIHENFWFIPVYLIAIVSYIILAGFMGAKQKYPEEEREEKEYEKALLAYVNQMVEPPVKEAEGTTVKLLKIVRFACLAVMLIIGCIFWVGGMGTETMKSTEGIVTLVYFICAIVQFMEEKRSAEPACEEVNG